MISTSMNTGRIKYYDDYDCEEEKNTVLVRVDAGDHSAVYPVWLVPDGINQDEAMGAMVAWALSKYGTEPLRHVSAGSF